MLPEIQNEGRDKYGSETELKTVGKGKTACPQGVLQLRGRQLSFLSDEAQYGVLEECELYDCTPSYSQAWRLHKADREGMLDRSVIHCIMNEEKANQRETVKVSADRLRNVLPRGMDAQKTEDFIIKACDYYRKYLIHQRDRDSR